MALIGCWACGNAVDLDKVQPMPGKRCPTCKAPLDEVAIEGMHFEGADASAIKLLRDQAKADVAKFQSEHAALSATKVPA